MTSYDDQQVAGLHGTEPSQRKSVSFAAALRRHVWIVLVATVVAAAAAAGVAYLNRNAYQSTAELLFDQTIGPQLNALGLTPPFNTTDRLAGDDAALVGSREVAALTARRLGSGASADSVQKDVAVVGSKTSDVVNVVAQAHSPEAAARLANIYAHAAIQLSQSNDSSRARSVMRDLNSQLAALPPRVRDGAAGQQVRTRIETLQAIATSGTGNPQLIQSGFLPTHKTGNLVQTIALGTLFGLLLGVALALLREQGDRRLRGAEDVSAAFEAPVLATVPRNRALERHAPFFSLPGNVAEAFFMLQSNLRYGRHSGPVRSLLITSSRSRQGKTTIAWNLACASASAGLSVALIDADLRRSDLAAKYQLRSFPGLAEVLRGDVEATHALQRIALPPRKVKGGAHNGGGKAFDVLVAGCSPPDSAALMQSPLMPDVLDDFRHRYDVVIVDTAPIAYVADAISLLRHVDGVLVVASVNSTQGPDAARLREQLQALDARVVGVVANGGSSVEGYTSYTSVPAQSAS